jgi:hypothetical protein
MKALAERAIVRGVTGWQGDEGHQGAWGPQGTQPYGAQPGAYGQDPQPDPYGGYQTGGFPAQGYPPGYGYPPPPPPPPRSKLPMVLGVLAIVIIVGAVVGIVLINRDSGGSPTAAPSSTEADPGPSTRSGPRSSDSPPPSSEEDDPDRNGWQKVDNSADSGLLYEVPPEWKVVPDVRASGLGVDFTGTADFGSYPCEGGNYVRSYATSGDVQAKDGAELDLAKTVKDVAASFAKGSFKDTAQVSVPEPTETEIDGRQAVTLTAKVTPQVTIPACEATEGEVAIVGVLLEEDGEPPGVAMLVVVSDVAGGPAEPKALPKTVAQEILASTSVG